MRRSSAIALILMGFTVTTALAANPHFLSGPSVTTSGGSLTVSGKIAGLGNQVVLKQSITS